jgi:hypothetical protein
MKKRLIFLVLILSAKSSFAWVPCMPFCDSGCGGAALQMMGTTISSASQSQASSNQNLLQSINDVTQSSINFGIDMSDVWTSSTMDILSALDARTSKIELAQTAQMKQREFSTDALNNTLTQSLRERFIAEKVSDNTKAFSKISMPETGVVAVNLARPLKEAYFKSHELATEVSSNQQQFSEELGIADSAYAVNARLTAPKEIYKGHLMVCEMTLSNDELNQMQQLITFVTNSKPLPMLSDQQLISPKGQEYELMRRTYNAKTTIISTIINEIISHKAQFVTPDIVRSYVSRSSIEPQLSLNETLDSLINGRLSSDGWYLNIKSLNETGLQREMTYLKAEENAILFLISLRREWRNQLLATIAVEEISQQLKQLKENTM